MFPFSEKELYRVLSCDQVKKEFVFAFRNHDLRQCTQKSMEDLSLSSLNSDSQRVNRLKPAQIYVGCAHFQLKVNELMKVVQTAINTLFYSILFLLFCVIRFV